jgi:RecB family exonuclease
MINHDEQLRLSVSKTKTFLDCQKKYYFAYVLKLPRKEFSFHTFGKFCHKVLEDFHLTYINGSQEPYNEVMTRVFKCAIQEYKNNMTKEMRKECWDIINQYLKIVYSCNIVKNVIACEKNFELNIENKIILNGMIDRIQLDDDNTLHVCDYKTTKNKSYIKDDFFQLLTYAYVLMCEDPTITKVRASYILLRHNFEFITKEFNKDEILSVKDKYIKYADTILSEIEFKPNPTVLCNYCDFLENCDAGKAKTNKLDVFGEINW